jgi:hypothetical protein
MPGRREDLQRVVVDVVLGAPERVHWPAQRGGGDDGVCARSAPYLCLENLH